MTRSSIVNIHALGKTNAFLAAEALRLTEPRSYGCGTAAPCSFVKRGFNFEV